MEEPNVAKPRRRRSASWKDVVSTILAQQKKGRNKEKKLYKKVTHILCLSLKTPQKGNFLQIVIIIFFLNLCIIKLV